MAENEIYEQILNKKFKKSVFTGYDPEDVDKFFDIVIEYLKNNNQDVLNIKKSFDKLKQDYDNLKKMVSDQQLIISKLKQKIKEFEEDGYINVSEVKRQQQSIEQNKGEK